ncbi:MAG: methionine biosynthesis protein MetW [Motiliproteus sp.]|jgi:methionine biosynthesis protein MetW
MRVDLDIIQAWIKPRSRVLDLGCGGGELLHFLQQDKQVHGYGMEINPEDIATCIDKGVNVIEQDLDQGLTNFQDKSFDVVIMTQALQAVERPDLVVDEMLRVGKEIIVTFPNFGHWRARFYLALKGKMPVSKFLPYTWYNTPNIHFCTFKDFEALCRQKNIHIVKRTVVNSKHRDHWITTLWPNMLGEIAIYHVTQ